MPYFGFLVILSLQLFEEVLLVHSFDFDDLRGLHTRLLDLFKNTLLFVLKQGNTILYFYLIVGQIF